MAFDYEVPNWLANTASTYGQLVSPLMLIALGVSLASLEPAGLPKSFVLSVTRFAIGLGNGVVEFFDLRGRGAGCGHLAERHASSSSVPLYVRPPV